MNREELPISYARTAYDIALDEWAGWLKAVHSQLSEEVDSTTLSAAEKQRRLEAIMPAGASHRFRQFIGFLADKDQIGVLGEITNAFRHLVEAGAGVQIAHVTTALELPAAERETVEASLRRRFGNVEFEYAVDTRLLGGMHIRVGDTVIDGSVAGRLEALRGQLTA